MNKEQAWKQICQQIKSDDIKIAGVVLSLILVVVGAFTLVFYVGTALVLAGAILLTITVRSGRNKIDNVDALYEKYILSEWLCEIFDDVKFDMDNEYSDDEIKELDEAGFFGGEWVDMFCNRAFSCRYKGYKLRAAQVMLSGKAEDEFKNSKWDYSEPEYLFWGCVWQIDTELDERQVSEVTEIIEGQDKDRWHALYCAGKLTFSCNMYEDMGAYPWWLVAPSKDNMDLKKLHDKVVEDMEPYVSIIKKIL